MLSIQIWEASCWKNSLGQKDREYINNVLKILPENSRIVIFLHYWRGIEFEEIAELMSVRLKEVELIHIKTLQLLSKVFRQKIKKEFDQYNEEIA